MKGKVIVAGKPKRGETVPFPAENGYKRYDVTSGSMNVIGSNKFKLTQCSPLFLSTKKYIFENLWQYSKIYPGLLHWDEENNCPTERWEQWRKNGLLRVKTNNKGGIKKGIRTPPEVARLKERCKGNGESWLPMCSWWNGEKLDYIASRKKIYVPAYVKLVAETDAFKGLVELVDGGQDVIIMDIDGPSLEHHPNGVQVTSEYIKHALEYKERPFGHGYIVAALLAGVDILEMCSTDPLFSERRKRKIEELDVSI